jgi:hypothetical protein
VRYSLGLTKRKLLVTPSTCSPLWSLLGWCWGQAWHCLCLHLCRFGPPFYWMNECTQTIIILLRILKLYELTTTFDSSQLLRAQKYVWYLSLGKIYYLKKKIGLWCDSGGSVKCKAQCHRNNSKERIRNSAPRPLSSSRFPQCVTWGTIPLGKKLAQVTSSWESLPSCVVQLDGAWAWIAQYFVLSQTLRCKHSTVTPKKATQPGCECLQCPRVCSLTTSRS